MIKNFDTRKYNIHLTKDGQKVPVTKRAKRALVTIKKFVEKNVRAEQGKVLIGTELNEALWSKGLKNPPSKVSVFVQNIKDGRVFVNLEGAPVWVKKEKKEEKKEEKKKDEGLEKLTEEFKTDKEKIEEKKKANQPSKKKK